MKSMGCIVQCFGNSFEMAVMFGSSPLLFCFAQPPTESLRMRTHVNLNLGKGAVLIYKQLNTC